MNFMTMREMVVQIIHLIEDDNGALAPEIKLAMQNDIKTLDVYDVDDYKIIVDDDDEVYLKNTKTGAVHCIPMDSSLMHNIDEYKTIKDVVMDSEFPQDTICMCLELIFLLNS